MLLKGGIIPSDGPAICLGTIKLFASFWWIPFASFLRGLHAEQLQDDWIHCSPTLSGATLIIPTAVILELFIYEMKLASK